MKALALLLTALSFSTVQCSSTSMDSLPLDTLNEILSYLGPNTFTRTMDALDGPVELAAASLCDRFKAAAPDLAAAIPSAWWKPWLLQAFASEHFASRCGHLRQHVCRIGAERRVLAVLLVDTCLALPDPEKRGIRDAFSEFLVHASQTGKTGVVERLLDEGTADPGYNASDALRSASVKGHAGVVRLLLQDGRSGPDARRFRGGGNSLIWASRLGHRDVVELLLEDGRARTSASFDSAIRGASGKGYTDVVKLLLADGRSDPADESIYAGPSALHAASWNEHDGVVKLLLEDGRADPAVHDSMLLRDIAMCGKYEIVKLLLEDARSDPAARSNEILRIASKYGDREIVRLLLEDGRADPAAGDSYALRNAFHNGYDKVVELLLQDGRAHWNKLFAIGWGLRSAAKTVRHKASRAGKLVGLCFRDRPSTTGSR